MKTVRLISCLAALALCVCLLPSPTWAAERQNDLIRVLLTRFNPVNELSVNISGSYTCGEAHFQRGVTVRITAGSKKDQLILRYQGIVLTFPGPITFTRHQTKGENGLRLQDGLNLYTGDLTVSNDRGQLRLILTLPIEEYLLGVLPWEMSSGFPLEALKAQAVAARTYALTRRNPARDYDVVDNTNDQVYAGISDDAAIIRQAVTGTAGICVYYQDQLVTCYYTASNGGQVETIENVWGKTKGQTGYIQAKADPYDLRNDESVVRQAVIPASLTEKDWPALQKLLRESAAQAVKAMGYTGAPEDVLIRGITDVSLSERKQALTFTLSLDAVRAESGDEEEASFLSNETPLPVPDTTPDPDGRRFYSLSNPVTVELPIFPALETALQLSINGANNELWTVRAEKDSFVIEARRFGHGVGMSQRGAQRMAAVYGWNYRQILHFYYSGVTLRRAPLTAVTPAPPEDYDFDATPGPPPTATPRPTLMPVTLKEGSAETLVIVDGVAQDSSLNLRASPDTASDILARLYYGQRLAVLDAAEGWLHVRTDAIEGYVMEKFVSPIEK